MESDYDNQVSNVDTTFYNNKDFRIITTPPKEQNKVPETKYLRTGISRFWDEDLKVAAVKKTNNIPNYEEVYNSLPVRSDRDKSN